MSQTPEATCQGEQGVCGKEASSYGGGGIVWGSTTTQQHCWWWSTAEEQCNWEDTEEEKAKVILTPLSPTHFPSSFPPCRHEQTVGDLHQELAMVGEVSKDVASYMLYMHYQNHPHVGTEAGEGAEGAIRATESLSCWEWAKSVKRKLL